MKLGWAQTEQLFPSLAWEKERLPSLCPPQLHLLSFASQVERAKDKIHSLS
jgi:hypothetical protein